MSKNNSRQRNQSVTKGSQDQLKRPLSSSQAVKVFFNHWWFHNYKLVTIHETVCWGHIFKLNRLPRKPFPASEHGLLAGSWMDGTEMLSGLREDVWGVGVEGLWGFSVLMQLTARKAECWLCRFKPATDGYGAKYWPCGLIKKITSGTSRRGQR